MNYEHNDTQGVTNPVKGCVNKLNRPLDPIEEDDCCDPESDTEKLWHVSFISILKTETDGHAQMVDVVDSGKDCTQSCN